jgi:hypothetical protein
MYNFFNSSSITYILRTIHKKNSTGKAVNSLVLMSSSFRIHLSCRKRGKLRSDKSGEYGGCSKAVTLCLARYFLTTNNRRADAMSGRRNQLFHAHFSRHFFVCSTPFWNKFTVDKTPSITRLGLLTVQIVMFKCMPLTLLHCHLTKWFFKHL